MKEKIENIEPTEIDKVKGNIELDKCVTAPHPEMIRNSDADEPCDDDRS